MAYIGNKPGAKYATLTRQTFSTPTGTSHTLSQTVTNSDDLLLYINNVKQNPADYTASGTTLTTASLAGGTEMYCLYYGKTTETVAVPSDSVDSSHIVDDAIDSEHYTDGSIDNVHLATGIDAAKLTTGTLPMARLSGTLPALNGSALTNLPSQSHIIGASAYRSGGQLIADSVGVQIQLNAELYDPNSDFDHSSGYDYVVPENGKYIVCSTIYLDAGNTTGFMEVMVYKNGSIIRGWQHRPVLTTSQGFGGTCVLNLATNDSIELWLVHNMGTSIDVVSSSTLNVFDIQKIAE